MDSSFLQVSEVSMKVALYAAETADPVLSVQNHMNKHLLKYNDKLEGVPICYRDINFEADKAYGHFFYEQPLVHVDVTGKVLIFKPTPGTIVTGKIIKVSETNVAILVLGLFNASLSQTAMQKASFRYSSSDRTWVSDSETWQEQSMVQFEVVSLQQSNGVVHLVGRPVSH